MVNVAHHSEVAILDELRAHDTDKNVPNPRPARIHGESHDIRMLHIPQADAKRLRQSALPA